MSNATQNGHRSPKASNLMTLTVQGFFSRVPWEGAPALEMLLGDEPNGVAPGPLSKQLTVADFFNRFMWEGTPEIAAPTLPFEVQPAPTQAESFTLDDFSSLF
jgi:hypothetical protein